MGRFEDGAQVGTLSFETPLPHEWHPTEMDMAPHEPHYGGSRPHRVENSVKLRDVVVDEEAEQADKPAPRSDEWDEFVAASGLSSARVHTR
jgi:hypothetical protein